MPWVETFRNALIALLVLHSSSASAAPGKAVVQLHLNNPTLDDYAARQNSNTAYFGVLSVGTPGKQFTGCFDTGSADAWLPTSSCTSASCQSHTMFFPNKSSTFQGTSTSFSIQYATGSVSGNVAYDTVNIGGINIPNQALGMVQQAGKELAWSSCDGIIGFGFDKLSQLGAPAPFFTMVQNALLLQNTFSFWLSPALVEPAGELVIGGVNPDRIAGSVTFLTVPNSTYWSVPLSGASIAGKNVALGATTAILDSSSTAITMGVSDCAALHQQIPGATLWANAGLYNISGGCNGISALPSISFQLGNQQFAIPPSLWVIKYQGACVSGFVPVSTVSLPNTQVVLGVPFLRAWHTQYSYDPTSQVAKIGLALPAAGPGPSPSPLPTPNPPLKPLTGSTSTAGRKMLSQQPESSGLPVPEQESQAQEHIFEAFIPSAKQRGLQ